MQLWKGPQEHITFGFVKSIIVLNSVQFGLMRICPPTVVYSPLEICLLSGCLKLQMGTLLPISSI